MNKEKIVNFFFEIASLRRLTRSHRQFIDEVNDNVSDHSFRVAIIGMILANLENCDEHKVLKMCLFHDIAEARMGDANAVNQQYLDLHEEDVRHDQAEGLPIAAQMLQTLQEYEQRKNKEALVAKDADILDQMILQQEYFFKDQKNGRIWHNYHEKRLVTLSAKTLSKLIRETNPLEWLYTLLEEKADINLER